MKMYKCVKRLAALLGYLLAVCMVSCTIPIYLISSPAYMIDEDTILQTSGAIEDSGDKTWSTEEETGSGFFASEPEESILPPSAEPEESAPSFPAEPEESALSSPAEPEESTSSSPAEPEESSSPVATRSEALPAIAVRPATASPSQPSGVIMDFMKPDMIILKAGQADESTWSSWLPQQAAATTNDAGEDVLCGLHWSVSHIRWDTPGVYYAEVDVIPPSGYVFWEYMDSCFEAVISIQAPDMSQVVDVFTNLGYYGQLGHTWTFAMKKGQDMAPLADRLQEITVYTGLLDSPKESILFTASWDFSAVDTSRTGLYPIYRSLKLQEDSLPAGLTPEQIQLPDYWNDLPVLLSVEGTEGPELYGVLENPEEFFGSYAALTDKELDELEVWYCVDHGSWTLQTDEGLMETDTGNYRIYKDKLETGHSYSFFLKLGNHTSSILTVRKKESPLVWLSWEMGGNRDGTIDVEFPSITQPPPTDTEETDSSQKETAGTEIPPATENRLPPQDNTSDGSSYQTHGPAGHAAGNFGDPIEATTVSEKTPEVSLPYETPTTSSEKADSATPDSAASKEAMGSPDSTVSPTGTAAPDHAAGSPAGPGTAPTPYETVTRWTSRISGGRIEKLLELYPEWILFQKESVAIYISSHWLEDQHLGPNDILTVSLSPGEDNSVEILINGTVPANAPVYRIEQLPKTRESYGGPAVIALMFLASGSVIFLMNQRWK